MSKNPLTYEIGDDQKALSHGPDWLIKLRQSAKDAFNAEELPRRALHLWRYTDPSRLLNLTEPTVEAGNSQMISQVQNGLTVVPLATAAESHGELVEKYLYSQVNNSTGKFEAMNGALWSDGLLVHIAKGVEINLPIHLVHNAPATGLQAYQRVLIVAEPGAKATIVDEYTGGSSDQENLSGTNGVVEIIGEKDSEIKYINFQNQNKATQSFLTHRAALAENAKMETIQIVLGGKLTKQNFGVRLDGTQAHSDMFGFAMGSDRQHLDNHTKHHHRHGDTTSDIVFKAVLMDKAQSAYTGLIRINQEAANCQAYQINRNLILSENAKAESIPELEILNEEVACSHGATMGDIDPEELFYLTSRGISHRAAVQMIVAGFGASILDRLPEELHDRIAEIVGKKLEKI